ncbi:MULTISPECIES: SDR family oxidoreductase [unclassified Mesorhizobium]|uniref:SDR family NAD(P)-dependent oxidoreductase n=1 Tax=unclassified Mesorhizobium TaxID=325217 RepID=UPI00112B8B4E|nr:MULTISPECIES: SDR family oxidoreductase [unclassified Mesorhizobium]MCA0025817.1 SDR family oxidoreductase [Mesorhizobium sp. B263B1A]TPJ90332.1 SDR family oxidoreductase [Mesorhizobium sp. B2-5-12]TPK20231.1 SDR family oxidoreductase [Mesorhizobium sp. B2-5-6]TPK27566.1 SDR family oxidoreductase [Mesorhizobium sp. B2-5-3]TPN39111.1 SDR family oxidoreductase [Mesorhizobium sp. B1-1-6]
MSIKDIFGLEGQHALVTGGGSGLGLAIATCFVEAGAKVTIVGTNAAKLAAACETLGPSATSHVFDVTDTAGATGFASEVEKKSGRVSILVNNAGNTVKKPLGEMSVEAFNSVLNVHVGGAFALSRAFLPQVTEARGSILFTASMSSFLGIPNVIGYSAAKAAYVGMVRALATELAPSGIRVNGVAPGWIDTALLRQATAADPERARKINSRIPMGRFGEGADIGWAMTYLASRASAYVTGHILVVDGGALHGF